MRKTPIIFCLLFLFLTFGPGAIAQDDSKTQDEPKAQATTKAPATPAHFYHLDFVVQELGADGKPTNSRTYTTTVSTDPLFPASIRVNSRIPVATGTYSSGEVKSSLVNTQFQYQNVGVNIDVRTTREIGRQLSFDLTADISSVAANSDPDLHQPIFRQNRWQAGVLIPIGKPTVVFTSDSLDSKGSMQVVVTATPLQ